MCKEFSTRISRLCVAYIWQKGRSNGTFSTPQCARLQNPSVAKFTELVELDVSYRLMTSLPVLAFRFRRYWGRNLSFELNYQRNGESERKNISQAVVSSEPYNISGPVGG